MKLSNRNRIGVDWSSNYAEEPKYENDHDDASQRDRQVHHQPPKALLIELEVGRAERGQRRVEGPPFGLDQFGLDSYVDPDSFTLR